MVEDTIPYASSPGRSGSGLCLSGGGFRAALFHLGSLRRLQEVGVLRSLSTISSVSGGSLLAGFLATVMTKRRMELGELDWESDVAEPFRAFVAQDLRTAPLLAHLAWNWALPRARLAHLEYRLRLRLTDLRLRELPEHPRFVFCATDLAFGVNWEFRRDRCGDYLAGYTEQLGDLPLARALVASACFPPLFGPMRLRIDPTTLRRGAYRGTDPDRDSLVKRLSLTDGGVYDNMALEPVLKRHATLLVSDGGAPFEFSIRRAPHRRLLRYTSVVSHQAQAVRRRLFFAGAGTGSYTGCYWRLASAPELEIGYPADLVTEQISEIRTDLDRFTAGESAVLENHGYAATEAALRRYLPELAAVGPPARAPHPDWLGPDRARQALHTSHRRLSLRRLLTPEQEAEIDRLRHVAGKQKEEPSRPQDTVTSDSEMSKSSSKRKR